MNAAFQSSIELLVLSTVCFLLSESFFVFWFGCIFFVIISVRFKGENWGRSVELKRIPDATATKFCNKVKLVLFVERVLFLKFDSVYNFGSSLRQTADFIYLGRGECPLSLSSAIESSSSCWLRLLTLIQIGRK